MPLHDKVIKELGYGMNMPRETDIVFMALWVSRRADGSLGSTVCNIEEEPLTDELRGRIAIILLNLAESIYPTQRTPDKIVGTCPKCGFTGTIEEHGRHMFPGVSDLKTGE